MKGGEWFMVDLGWDNTKVGKIVLDTSGSSNDYPRGYEVYVSNNPDNMGDPVATGKAESGVLQISFGPRSGRYVKIVQTGNAEGNFWSIHEMTVSAE